MTAAALTALYLSVSASFGLPSGLLSAVCYVESGHRATAVHKDDGGEDSVGLCQLHPSTARRFGFKGPPEALLGARTNARYAAKVLRYQLDRYAQSPSQAVSAYNIGTYRESRHGGPLNRRYVDKVMRAWAEGR